MSNAVSETARNPSATRVMVFVLIIALLFTTSLTGTDSVAAELTRLRISIPGLGSSSYPLIMAQKKGYFRAEGYDLELIPMAGGLAVKTLMAGEVNLTSAGTVVAILQGARVRLVMGFIRLLPYDLITAPEIKRVEDLRAKKVAVADRGSVTFFVVRSILQAHGLEPDKDVTILNMGRPDVRYQALMTGNVQAVVANFDGTGMLEPKGFHSVAKAGRYGKGFAGSLSVMQDQLEKRPDDVIKFIRATLKGTRAYLQLRDEAIRITAEWTRITPVNAAKVHELMSAGALAPDGLLDRETMEAVISDAKDVTGVKRSVKTDEVFDFRLMQRVNEELQSWRP